MSTYKLNTKIEIPIGKSKKVYEDKVNYLLSYVGWTPYWDRSIKDGWVPVNAKILRDVIGPDYSKVIKSCKTQGLLESNETYKKGLVSTKYRLTDKVNKKGVVMDKNNRYMLKTIKMINENNAKKNDYKTQYIIEETIRGFNEGRYKFDSNSFVQKMIRLLPEDSRICQQALFDRIVNGHITCTSDSQGARIYGNHSNLKKSIRRRLQIDGDYMLTIDIANSQLQTLSLYLQEKYPSRSKGVMKFYELCYEGKIYEFFADKLTKGRRDEIKQPMLNWLYAESFVSREKKGLVSEIDQCFKVFFPEVYSMINEIKGRTNGGAILSRKMQLLESNIIKDIQFKLMRDMNVYCLTIHDSFNFNRNINKDIIQFTATLLRTSGYGKLSIEDNKMEIDKINIQVRKKNREDIVYGSKNLKVIVNKIDKDKKDYSRYLNPDKVFDDFLKEMKRYR